MKRLLTLAASALALASVPVSAQDMVITNAKLVTGDGGDPIDNGTVVVRGGSVVAAGAGVAAPADLPSVDAGGAWVTPGIFASVTSLGLVDVNAVGDSNDTRAGGAPFSAALDIAPVINPGSQHILVSRAAGITRAAVSAPPSGSIFGGQGAIIDLDGDATPVTTSRAFQMVALGEYGARVAGGSRASAFILLRNALREASALRGKTGTPQTTEIVKDDDLFLSRFDHS